MTHRTGCADFGNLIFVTRRPHPSYLFAEQPPLRPGVALALGGGFARGYAHLGVLRILEENNIPLSCLSGTSIGSIIAAAYASGTPLDRIVAKCREIRFRDFARWRVSRFGLASNERLGALVQRFFDSKQFEDLLIPTVIVATDLGTGDPVLFKQGSIADAIRASCAFPRAIRTSAAWHSVSGRRRIGRAGADACGARAWGANCRGRFGRIARRPTRRAHQHIPSCQPRSKCRAETPTGSLGAARRPGPAPRRAVPRLG